jgi:XapX domain-containing protein
MIKAIIGCVLAFAIGAACRYFDIPCPAPSALLGAVLVVFMCLGYVAVDRALAGARPAPVAHVEPTRRP